MKLLVGKAILFSGSTDHLLWDFFKTKLTFHICFNPTESLVRICFWKEGIFFYKEKDWWYIVALMLTVS